MKQSSRRLMSDEQLKAFLEKVKADSSLREKLKVATDVQAVLAIAKDAGFMLSVDDLKSAQSDLSDEEIEGVAGGTVTCTLDWCRNPTLCSQPGVILTLQSPCNLRDF